MNSAVSPNNDFTDGKAHEVVIIRRPIEVEMQVGLYAPWVCTYSLVEFVLPSIHPNVCLLAASENAHNS